MLNVIFFIILIFFIVTMFFDRKNLEQKSRELALMNIVLAETRIKLEVEQEKCLSCENADKFLREKFEHLSAVALKNNNESFMNLAKTSFSGLTKEAGSNIELKLQPIFEILSKFDNKVHQLETQRNSAYTELSQQLIFANQANMLLQKETNNLVNALRKPDVRGRWGEMQLRKTVEIAGMTQYIDFVEQGSVLGENGILRPDMIVNLPNNRQIIVDSKAPLASYLSAIDAQSPVEAENFMKIYVEHIKKHIMQLSSKTYWQSLESSPEFVVLFLPGEKFFSDALSYNPSLIEFSVDKKVIIATPTTLIALLKTVAYGWKQDKIAAEAKEIAISGHELFKRVKLFLEYFDKVGKSLGDSVKIYNEAWSSCQSRLMPQARKFEQFISNDSAFEMKNFINNQPYSQISSDN